jgi:pimeloyl-ACP methyl ester carboxylesterase
MTPPLHRTVLSALLALAAAMFATGSAGATASPATVRQVPCAYALEGEAVRCATLVVPSQGAVADGASISLPVVVLPALGPSPRREPIIYLTGGPGGSTFGMLRVLARYRDLRWSQDLILLEQRGNSHAEPSLACLEAEIVPSCHTRLRRGGIVLERFDTAAAADDVARLIAALGVPKADILGLSYGTTVALTLMRRHPESLRAVILDSPTPPSVEITRADMESQLDAFTRLFRACASDATCHRAYPELRERLLRLIERLDRQPVDGIDGRALVGAIVPAMYRAATLVAVPRAIALAEHDPGAALQLLAVPAFPLPEGLGRDRLFSRGLELSVYCREEIPFSTVGRRRLRTIERWPSYLVDHVRPGYHADCLSGTWPISPAPRSATAPVRSEVPTLILVGERDAWTSARIARETLAPLLQGQLAVLPDTGHGTIRENACARQLVVAFLADPKRAIDRRCTRDIPPARWIMPEDQP